MRHAQDRRPDNHDSDSKAENPKATDLSFKDMKNISNTSRLSLFGEAPKIFKTVLSSLRYLIASLIQNEKKNYLEKDLEKELGYEYCQDSVSK